MLGKLMKHEWKATCRMGCLMLGAMVFVTLLGWLSFQAPMWRSLGGYGSFDGLGWVDVLSFFSLGLYAILAAGVSFCLLIYLGVRFYRTMYTDEGYLTHTLPVTKGQILASKLIVSGIWELLIVLSIYLSVMLIVLSMIAAFLPDNYSLSRLWGEFAFGIWDFLEEMGMWLDFEAFHVLGVMIAASLLGPFTTVAILFGAISLGQLVPKGRFMMGILFYVIILVAQQMLVSLFYSFAYTAGVYIRIRTEVSIAVNLLTAIVLYVLSYYVISKKLNMT